MRRVLSSLLILCAGGALGWILRPLSRVSVSEAQAAGGQRAGVEKCVEVLKDFELFGESGLPYRLTRAALSAQNGTKETADSAGQLEGVSPGDAEVAAR